MNSLQIQMLGTADVRRGDQPVQWRAASARGLFFYLMTYPAGRSRTQIIGALWNADPDAQLSNRFRVAVHRTRAALGAKDTLLEDHNRYRLSPEVLAASDVQAFQNGLDAVRRDSLPLSRLARLQDLVHRFAGDYLPLESADWAFQAREEHRATYVQAQTELSGLHCGAGACARSVESLAVALKSDPYMGENHHQRLMTCLSVTEGKYAATEHYRRFVSFLRLEVNDLPMAETVNLASRIKDGEHICRRQTQGQGTPDTHPCPFATGFPDPEPSCTSPLPTRSGHRLQMFRSEVSRS